MFIFIFYDTIIFKYDTRIIFHIHIPFYFHLKKRYNFFKKIHKLDKIKTRDYIKENFIEFFLIRLFLILD